jgi:hypothetical protein
MPILSTHSNSGGHSCLNEGGPAGFREETREAVGAVPVNHHKAAAGVLRADAEPFSELGTVSHRSCIDPVLSLMKRA